MVTKDIVYFARVGAGNTEGVIEAVRERAKELRIEHVVIASASGETTLKFWEALKGTGAKLISVCEHAGYDGGDEISISEEARKDLENKGIKVLVCSHALSGVSRSMTKKFGGISPVEVEWKHSVGGTSEDQGFRKNHSAHPMTIARASPIRTPISK